MMPTGSCCPVKMNVLLSTTYFGPIQWYQKLFRADEVWIERHETFQKQTYRNRCVIATTQGTQALTVPVERISTSTLRSTTGRSQGENTQHSTLNPQHSTLKDLRISDHGNWRHLHWNALRSAYGDSPFFMYYEDDIRPFFEQRWDYLFDFNEAIREKMCELLDIQPNVRYTEMGIRRQGVQGVQGVQDITRNRRTIVLNSLNSLSPCLPIIDFRDAINPKHPGEDPDFEPRRYYQVYEAKHGFQPNLSIVDLLFNMGPEAIFYL